jgi:antitoxin ParD1/3/4
MNVSLTSEMEKFIGRQVKSGQYQTASEVVRDALRLLKDREQLRQIKLEELRKEIQIGIDQIERGDVVDGEKVFEEIRKRSTAMRRKRA